MTFELPPLNYPKNALAPVMSEETLDLHHGKHHQTYITNLNNFVKDTDLSGLSLEEIISKTAADTSKAGIFNNAGQHWNHILFWKCMKPSGGGKMPDKLEKKCYLKKTTALPFSQFNMKICGICIKKR